MAVLSEEQTMIRDGAKAWVREKSPVAAFRKLRDSRNADGFDRAIWRDMAAMGWTGILIPEEFGGTALGYQTLGLVLEETGRTLTASPLISTALTATTALLLAGSDAQKQKYLAAIAEGTLIATLGVDEGPHHAPEKVALKGSKSGSGVTLDGRKMHVPDGGAADLVIVAARTGGRPGEKGGITLVLADGNASGLTRETLHTADSRAYANLTFRNVEGEVLGTFDQGEDVLEATLDRARIGLTAEMLGHAAQSFDVTLDYLKTRVQFGQVIGTFQALQHRAAKMFTDLELARSCVEAALAAIDANANDVAQLASLAKAKVGDLVHLVSNEMVQLHGGIGMTDAHDAGLYLKRARAQEAMFGSRSYHRERYATLLGY
jgi:alkylation response protein AidB-like acyl-CoA dehydrogenase